MISVAALYLATVGSPHPRRKLHGSLLSLFLFPAFPGLFFPLAVNLLLRPGFQKRGCFVRELRILTKLALDYSTRKTLVFLWVFSFQFLQSPSELV